MGMNGDHFGDHFWENFFWETHGRLVGGLVAMFYFPIFIGFLIIPIDELIFLRGVAQPPTRRCSGKWGDVFLRCMGTRMDCFMGFSGDFCCGEWGAYCPPANFYSLTLKMVHFKGYLKIEYSPSRGNAVGSDSERFGDPIFPRNGEPVGTTISVSQPPDNQWRYGSFQKWGYPQMDGFC